jgi:diguanylate cyclase (GGDEF)-like protein
VSPRFYETTWFYALCFVAVAAVASGGLRVRARQARTREDELTRVVRERTRQLQEANDRLQELSYNDPLTGISNRRRFEEMLEAEWRRAYRNEQSLAILMIDVDRFKVYNDVFGHQAGDDCLVTVARVLSQSVLRAGDLVARYGGEEFAAILIGTDLGGASDVAGRLRAAVESLGLGAGTERSRPVTVSIGAAAARPRDGISAATLVGTADRALYQAKNAGRNCIKTARPDVE